EPLGMFEPRLRKLLLKRLLDATLYRGVARGAAAVVVASERERDAVIACGVPAAKVHIRGNGFPDPGEMAADGHGDLRAQLSIPGVVQDGDALVVPYDRTAVVDAVRRVLSDAALCKQLARGGIAAARRTSWDRVADVQEEIYREVASRTAATKFSTDGS